MLKRFGSGSMDDDRLGTEEINPMAGVSNLADVMLVLAVGIMLALIINWKIDVGQQNEVSQIEQEDMTEITDYDSINGDEVSEKLGEDGLEKKGTVYVDPDTGKMYVVVTGEE